MRVQEASEVRRGFGPLLGENDPATRAEVVAGCGWLGLTLDPALNESTTGCITSAGSRLQTWVIPTNEELMIARHTASALDLALA